MSFAPVPDHAFLHTSEQGSGIPMAMAVTNTGISAPIGIRADNALLTWITGACGSGKSSLLRSMFHAAVCQSRPTVLLDAKGDLDQVLDLIPLEREGDVCIIGDGDDLLGEPSQASLDPFGLSSINNSCLDGIVSDFFAVCAPDFMQSPSHQQIVRFALQALRDAEPDGRACAKSLFELMVSGGNTPRPRTGRGVAAAAAGERADFAHTLNQTAP